MKPVSFIAATAGLAVSILLTPVQPAWAGAPQSLFCEGTTKRKAGTLLNIDADLAIEMVKRQFPTLQATRVAVIDSGFDPAMQAFFRNPVIVKPALSASVWTKLQFWKNVDPKYTSHIERDEVGHGTAVSALIGATGGIGVNPYVRITMYKATDADSGSFREDALKSAIQAACNDGNEIINMSLGGQLDEMNFASVTKGLDGWLNSKGCQVVAAAGNSGIKNKGETSYVHDGVIKVGALTRTNAPSDLTSGEIAAVGIYAFTLAAHGSDFTKFGKESSFHCGSDPRFVMLPGTSFSTPQVAGVLALIRSVLKQHPRFLKLSIAEQLKLQKDILKFSAIPAGQINSLRAVAVATAALRTNLRDRGAIVRAFRADAAKEVARSARVVCQNLNDRTCVDAERTAAAFNIARDESLAAIAHLAANETNYELFYSTLRGLPAAARVPFAADSASILKRLKASPFELMSYYRDHRELFGTRIPPFEKGLRSKLPQAITRFRDGDPAHIQFWADATKLKLVDNRVLQSVVDASRTQPRVFPLIAVILKTSPLSLEATIPALNEFIAAGERDLRTQAAEALKADPKQDRHLLQKAVREAKEANVAIALMTLSQSHFNDSSALESFVSRLTKPSSAAITGSVFTVLVERPVKGREERITEMLSQPNPSTDLLASIDIKKLMLLSPSLVPEWTLALTRQWHAPLSNFVLSDYIQKEKSFTDAQRMKFFAEMAKTLVRTDVRSRSNYELIKGGVAHVITGLQDVRSRQPRPEINRLIQELAKLLPSEMRQFYN